MEELCEICSEPMTEDELENGGGDICSKCYWNALDEYDEEMKDALRN